MVTSLITFLSRRLSLSTGRKSKKLVEPMLEGEFLKFNSNSGYISGSDFMQALSHFSYNHSRGQFLLCDLQGGHYQDSYVLTDPVVMSSDNEKRFGATDLGSEGISIFSLITSAIASARVLG